MIADNSVISNDFLLIKCSFNLIGIIPKMREAHVYSASYFLVRYAQLASHQVFYLSALQIQSSLFFYSS